MFPHHRTNEWDSPQDRAQAAECTHAPEPTDQLPNGETRERWTYWSSRYAELEKKYDEALRNYSIADADAKRLQAQVDQMALEVQRSQDRISKLEAERDFAKGLSSARAERIRQLQEQIAEARRTGHREGLEILRELVEAIYDEIPVVAENSKLLAPAAKARILIDSPKAEVEEQK